MGRSRQLAEGHGDLSHRNRRTLGAKTSSSDEMVKQRVCSFVRAAVKKHTADWLALTADI